MYIQLIILNFPDVADRWVVSYEVANYVPLNMHSKKQNISFLPVRGWRYADGNEYQDDETLIVTGKYIS